MQTDLEHIADQIAFYEAALELRLGAGDAERCAATLERVAEHAARADSAAAVVVERLDLTTTEAQVMWLLVVIACSEHVRELLGRATRAATPDPSSHAIKAIVYGSAPSRTALAELSSEGRLRRLGVIERSDAGGADVHETRQTWAISRRVLAALHGSNDIDAALARSCVPYEARATAELAVCGDAVVAARAALRDGRRPVLACGTPGLGRTSLLVAVAKELGREVLVLDGKRLARDASGLARQLVAIRRECALRGCVPLIADLDALDDLAIEELGELVLATSTRPRSGMCVVELRQPTGAQLEALWRSLVPGADAAELAARFPIAPALACRAVASGDDIAATVRAELDERLGQHARRITVTQTWDDIVLPPEQFDALVELVARIRQRSRVHEDWGFGAKVGKGLGVSALFSGPPGTGKTMVAGLIARELGRDLYQVDLGKVISKWIGETEKALGELFDAAEAGNAILLFDECDALFGKRTDVRSSNDRYANLETNYLLQRLESFTGVCLLTSNHESLIDPAFQRRIAVHVRFELPDAAQRRELWRAMLPAAAPTAPDLDFDDLAERFAMSGGYVRNAALRAAFLAADRGEPITAALLEHAARLEYEAMGKLAL